MLWSERNLCVLHAATSIMKYASIQFLLFLYLPYTPPYPSTSLRAGKGREWRKEQELSIKQ